MTPKITKQDYAKLALKIASKILEIGDILEIEYNNTTETNIAAKFYPEVFTIYVYNKAIINFNPIEIMATIFHEAYHGYEVFCIFVKDNENLNLETDDRITLWKKEFDDYIKPSGNDHEYLSQDIELEAIAFAHYITYELFGQRTYIPVNIKQRIEEKIDYFKLKYQNKLIEFKNESGN